MVPSELRNPLHCRDQPDQVFFEGIERLGLDLTTLETIVHGSTMVINTVVQERGAPIGLITNAGFRDVLELARGNRLDIYDLFYKQPAPLVPRYLRLEAKGRINFKGEELVPLDEEDVRAAAHKLKEAGVHSIAVCYFHAYANPNHELRTAELIREVFPRGSRLPITRRLGRVARVRTHLHQRPQRLCDAQHGSLSRLA